ncbi:MAG TPA: transposase [Terriglobales bacterium]|nr:transposase [Terriglobales bacterium]
MWRRPILGSAPRRDLLVTILDQVRQRYRFIVRGYVVMPEHIHLLISEPERGTPSTVMQVLKQGFARRLHRGRKGPESQGRLWPEPAVGQVWQERFYDFNVWSRKKMVEKIRYMHRNPVTRGLVAQPDHWAWSSYRSYAYHEVGKVRVNFQEWPLVIQRIGAAKAEPHVPALSQRTRKDGAPRGG